MHLASASRRQVRYSVGDVIDDSDLADA